MLILIEHMYLSFKNFKWSQNIFLIKCKAIYCFLKVSTVLSNFLLSALLTWSCWRSYIYHWRKHRLRFYSLSIIVM